jgi:hypothetical protein
MTFERADIARALQADPKDVGDVLMAIDAWRCRCAVTKSWHLE